MITHLFGAATPSGEALRQLAGLDLVGYSRNASSESDWIYPADLNVPDGFHPAIHREAPAIWISFAPIWLLAPFLEHLATHHPQRLNGLHGVVACSSSSVITKRFAVNRFDHQLVAKLNAAEDLILSTCRRLSIPCCIVRPTLIYGRYGAYADRNLSRLLQLLRRLPVLLLPSDSGLRQPIHACQLASVVFHLAEQLAESGWDPSLPERIAVGGDTTLTYVEMISALQQAQPLADPARRCCLLSIPNRLFFLLAAPVLLRSPRAFEAVLRMGSNLSGFTPAHQIIGSAAQSFPVMPLA